MTYIGIESGVFAECTPCHDPNCLNCPGTGCTKCIEGFSLHGMINKVCTKCTQENCSYCDVNVD